MPAEQQAAEALPLPLPNPSGLKVRGRGLSTAVVFWFSSGIDAIGSPAAARRFRRSPVLLRTDLPKSYLLQGDIRDVFEQTDTQRGPQ